MTRSPRPTPSMPSSPMLLPCCAARTARPSARSPTTTPCSSPPRRAARARRQVHGDFARSIRPSLPAAQQATELAIRCGDATQVGRVRRVASGTRELSFAHHTICACERERDCPRTDPAPNYRWTCRTPTWPSLAARSSTARRCYSAGARYAPPKRGLDPNGAPHRPLAPCPRQADARDGGDCWQHGRRLLLHHALQGLAVQVAPPRTRTPASS